MEKSNLGDRMKGYEKVSRSKVLRRTPTIIRLDGKAFHTWTRQLKKIDPVLAKQPFSWVMHDLMRATTVYLMANIQNAVLAYTQSDEISIVLNDWKGLKTDQWFDGNIQKIVSVSASMATAAFNENRLEYSQLADVDLSLALFDSRVYNVPFAEVTNYFIWRQQDATRNSINMLGQYYFSHKSLQHKNVSQVQDKLMLEENVNWNDIPTWQKRGFCVARNGHVDVNIPIFTKDRDYIEEVLVLEES